MVQALKVLVVDDEPTVIRSCRRILTEDGYRVDATESGQEGLNRSLAQDFNLVMADLRMPDLDGMELVRSLRSRRPQTAVIIITGYGTVPSAVEATKLGVSDYIEKPFTPERVREAVAQALEPAGRRARVEIEADLVREVLRLASRDDDFGRRLLMEGSLVLSGFALSGEAKAAIISGDVAWVEKRCGELSGEERDWLERRLQAEIW